jgi:L-ascorbate metabolism protein UlaG (beta-lactamase superfamily)
VIRGDLSIRLATPRIRILFVAGLLASACAPVNPDYDAGGRSFYFAGDTGYGPDFAEIGRRFDGIDLALIPIDAYEPRWFMADQHVNPDEAILIHRDIKARRSVGIHWGTFLLTDEPLDQPLSDFNVARAKAGIDAREFLKLRHGQTLNLDTEPKR